MEKIKVLDFGSQYTHLIAKRLRELGIYSEIVDPHKFTQIDHETVGIILSGGPASVLDPKSPTISFDIHSVKVPILGICYGHQLLAKLLGGLVTKGKEKEYGSAVASLDVTSPIFEGLIENETVWMSHGDSVETLPPGFKATASSQNSKITAFQSDNKKIFGLQFHPEVSHTINGQAIIDNFINVCTLKRPWRINNVKDLLIKEVRDKAQNKNLLILVSGGVDSLVALEVCKKAVGTANIYPVHIDNGLMRKNESTEVIQFLKKAGFANMQFIQAENLFLDALKSTSDPEEKRAIIGRLFVEVSHNALKKFNISDNWLLVQGTIYPDTIESGATKNSQKIKTHHNRVPEIEALIKQGKVLEPLKDFYKNEVRKLGEALSLPYELINRHPFPGPGLGVRLLSNKPLKNGVSPEAELKAEELANEHGFNLKVLPVQSVGVQGDERTYMQPAVIWQNKNRVLNWPELKTLMSAIVNKFPINRVILSLNEYKNDLTVFQNNLDKQNLNKLREVDSIIREELSFDNKIWQLGVISLPLQSNDNKSAYVVRAVYSEDAMTAESAEIGFDTLTEINDLLKEKVSYIFIDLTSKPPATIEWE